MPFAGLGLHIVIALFFAVHAVRNGQPLYWLFVLFSFPLLGSIVYFAVIYLPSSRLQRSARKVVSVAHKALDPHRELRQAQDAFDYTPTAHNRMRLAIALSDAGFPQEAAQNYEACLRGVFADDLDIRFGAAQSYYTCQRADEAITHLRFIQQKDGNYRAEQVSLLLAQCFAHSGQHNEAKAEFESALRRFGSFECQAEFALWAVKNNEPELAESLNHDMQKCMTRWNRHTRELNSDLIRRINAAFAKN